MARRHSSGSNFSCRITVARSGVLICRQPSPQAWKTGAEMSMVSFIFIGIRESIAAMTANPRGVGRNAPLGVPDVPEVCTTWWPGRVGGNTPGLSATTKSSSPRRPLMALRRPVLTSSTSQGTYRTSSSRSSSTNTLVRLFRATAIWIWVAANALLRSITSTPSMPKAMRHSTMAMLFRASRPILDVSLMPSRIRPVAIASARRSSCSKVSCPASSAIASCLGARAAAAAYPP